MLDNIAKKMTENSGIIEKKNHSARKTAIQTLLHATVEPTAVMQLSGHKIVQSLNSYAHLSQEQQRAMSHILSARSNQLSHCASNLPPCESDISPSHQYSNISQTQKPTVILHYPADNVVQALDNTNHSIASDADIIAQLFSENNFLFFSFFLHKLICFLRSPL